MQIRLFKPKRHHLSPYVLKMLSRTPFVCVKYLFPQFPCRAWRKYTWFWSKFVHEIWVCPLAALAPLATLWSPGWHCLLLHPIAPYGSSRMTAPVVGQQDRVGWPGGDRESNSNWRRTLSPNSNSIRKLTENWLETGFLLRAQSPTKELGTTT